MKLLSRRDVIDCFEQFSFVTQEALGHGWFYHQDELYAEVYIAFINDSVVYYDVRRALGELGHLGIEVSLCLERLLVE